MQIVPISGLRVSPGYDDVDRLTPKHSSSSSKLSDVMGILTHSDQSVSSNLSDEVVEV